MNGIHDMGGMQDMGPINTRRASRSFMSAGRHGSSRWFAE